MIEGSSSLNQWGENNFQKVVNAVEILTKNFNDSQSNVGIVLYATEAELKANFSFSSSQTVDVLENLIYPSGWTRIGKGLNFTREELFNNSRTTAHRVLVVITDGTSIESVLVPSDLLRQMNVTILAVGLGDWYDAKQINHIASDPDSKTSLFTTYDELGSLTWRLHEMVCQGKSGNRIVFVVDIVYPISNRITVLFQLTAFLTITNRQIKVAWQHKTKKTRFSSFCCSCGSLL